MVARKVSPVSAVLSSNHLLVVTGRIELNLALFRLLETRDAARHAFASREAHPLR